MAVYEKSKFNGLSAPRRSVGLERNSRGALHIQNWDNSRRRITRGSRNVFADLGFPDAAERQARLHLAYALNRVLDDRKLAQAEAAKMLGLTQPKVSALRYYKLVGFSLERLMNLLTAIDHDIEIVIRPKPRSRKAARIRVVANARRRTWRICGMIERVS